MGEENIEGDPIKDESIARAIEESYYGDAELVNPTPDGTQFREVVQQQAELHDKKVAREKDPHETPFSTPFAEDRRRNKVAEIKTLLRGEEDLPVAERDKAIDQSVDELNVLIEGEKHKINKKFEQNEMIKNELIDKKYEPLSELYDSDPERFANMPTEEFMRIAAERAAKSTE